MDRLKWGVLGAGGIAARRTIPGMLLAKNVELVALMDVRRDLAEGLGTKFGVDAVYTDEDELLDNPQVEAVYIASPVAEHARQALKAADRGKHLLVEKPLALTSQEGRQVVEYCREKGVRIAAGFMMRFGSHVRSMKQSFQDGKIGDLVSAYAQFTCWYPDMPGAWRQTKASAGGGALMDMGVHCIDLVQYIAQSRVTQVCALQDTLTFSYEVEDSSAVLLRLENGALCVIQSNFNIPDEAAKWRLELFGTKGRLLGDSVIGQVDGGRLEGMFLQASKKYDAQQDIRQGERIDFDAAFGDLYTREMESFSRSVLYGEPLEAPAEEAVQVQEVVEAAYRSADEKRTIDFI